MNILQVFLLNFLPLPVLNIRLKIGTINLNLKIWLFFHL